MASIKIKIDPSGITRRANDYAVNVIAKMQSSASIIVEAITADVLSRTPTPELEAELINFGQEGQSALPVTNTRQSSNNKGRNSFIREPGMWLQEAIAQANSISPQGFSIRLGNLALLDEITKFSWMDSSKQLGDQEHTTNYGMFPLFEFGSNVLGFGHVTPSFGSNYYLTPAPYTRVPDMNKTIPPFGMYTHLNSEWVLQLIKEKIREVNF